MGGKTIIISSTNANAVTAIGINGRHRDLPHNKEIPVSEAELEVLTNSNVTFEIVGGAKAVKDAVDQGGGDVGAQTSGQVPGGDNPTHGANDEPAVVTLIPPESKQVPGGDNPTHGEHPEVDLEAAKQDAIDAAAASADGTTEPVVVLTNEDPDQLGTVATEASLAAADKSGLAVSPFDADKTLGQSIAKITEDLDEFDASQVKALLKAEKKGKARTTLIEALERKAAAS